jgi:hypothetical protein
MKQRCTNSRNKSFPQYGGRNHPITFDPRWSDLATFIHDIESTIGPRPAGMQLDRPDTYGNYEPGNVRWVTRRVNNNNKRNNRQLTFQGRTQTMAEWAEELGLNYATLAARIKHGWSVERALTQ